MDKTYETYLGLATKDEKDEEKEDAERKKITRIRLAPNPNVTKCTRVCLALLRAFIFTALTATLLYLQMWWATVYEWHEIPLNITGTLNKTSILSSIEENCLVDESVVDLWAKELSDERSLIAEVHPISSFSSLPVMTFYISEEVYRNRGGWIPLLSFSARLAKPAEVYLTVEQDLNETEYLTLLEAAFLRHNFLVEDDDDPRWTGKFLVGHQSDHHQEMLWDHENGWTYYKPSTDWQFLMAVAFIILFVTCSTIMKFIILEAETDWREACQVWITQNENLWEQAKKGAAAKGKEPIREDKKKVTKIHPEKPEKVPKKWSDDEEKGVASGDDKKLAAKKAAKAKLEVEPVEVNVSWDECLLMCSPFFVLDNTLSNAYLCEEEVSWATMSALLHSLVFCFCPLLPCIACHFMKGWVPYFSFLIIAYGGAVIPLGLSYYFTLQHGRLNLTFALLQIFVMFCWLVATVLYLISALIYLAAVSAIDSQLLIDALIPLATIFAYATVIITRLKALQAHYIAASEGTKTKGFLMYETQRLGFSTASILVLALEGVATLFGLFLIQLAIRNLYAGSKLVQNNLLQAAILPTYALINAMLNLKSEKLTEAGDEIKGDLVNTITEIF